MVIISSIFEQELGGGHREFCTIHNNFNDTVVVFLVKAWKPGYLFYEGYEQGFIVFGLSPDIILQSRLEHCKEHTFPHIPHQVLLKSVKNIQTYCSLKIYFVLILYCVC